MDFYALAQQCSPQIEKEVAAAISHTESTFNLFAIGLVGGSVRQPKTYADAIYTVRSLRANGRNFSVGLTQINQSNFSRYGLNESNMFDPCTNLKVSASIYKSCFDKAEKLYGNKYSYDGKLRLAASCYYSGNFTTGFKVDFPGQPPYVTKFYNKLLAYRSNRSTQMVRGSEKVQQTQPIQPIKRLDPTVSKEYDKILKAINLQKQNLSTQSTVVTQTVVETDDETTVSNGDLFAKPSEDIFRKQGILN